MVRVRSEAIGRPSLEKPPRSPKVSSNEATRNKNEKAERSTACISNRMHVRRLRNAGLRTGGAEGSTSATKHILVCGQPKPNLAAHALRRASAVRLANKQRPEAQTLALLPRLASERCKGTATQRPAHRDASHLVPDAELRMKRPDQRLRIRAWSYHAPSPSHRPPPRRRRQRRLSVDPASRIAAAVVFETRASSTPHGRPRNVE